jgi:hypothetical protein
MKKITKAAAIVMYLILLLIVIFTGLMFLGGTVAGDANDTPVYTDSMLQFTYGLILLGVGMIIVFEIINLILHPQAAKRSLISILIVGAIIALAYSFADGTPLTILGYEGSDNIPSMLMLTDTGLYTFYILLGVLVLGIVGTEASRLFK